MQPLTKHREVSTEGVTASTAFTISIKDQAHIKSILRDTLYSDKVLAVLREYSANAWDAHRMAGKADKPIKVQIPTWAEPTLVIQDWGSGLSHEDVFEVFAKYGASTKRDTNDAVGMLGIGSKSGFAYSDSFTIISRHGGKARTYVALLDDSENDTINLLNEEDCGDDTGITIQIAVRNEDVREFERKAQMLFQHFTPRPDINIHLNDPPEIRSKLTHGIIYDKNVDSYYGGEWYAVMGCVPYKIDIDQLRDVNGKYMISQNFKQTSGLLSFAIGEVQINASREELKYSKITKEALVKKFNDLLDEFVVVTVQEIEKSSSSCWARRLSAKTLLRLGLGKDEIGELAAIRIIIEDPKSFQFQTHCGSETGSIPVNSDIRLVRYNPPKKHKLKGYNLGSSDYLVVPRAIEIADPITGEVKVTDQYQSWDTVNAELETILKTNQMDGIPIVNLADLPWTPPVKRIVTRSNKPVNAKHMVSTFRLTGGSYGQKAQSENWTIEHRVPTPDDVFVIINHFQTQSQRINQNFNIVALRHEDARIAAAFGIQLPEIYGYKYTEKKKTTVADVTGIHYPEWRKKFFASIPLEKVKQWREIMAWSQIFNVGYRYDNKLINHDYFLTCRCELGPNHPICQYMENGFRYFSQNTREWSQVINMLENYDVVVPKPDEEPEAQRMKAQIEAKYPLLSIRRLGSPEVLEWLRYIKLIDMDDLAKSWQFNLTPTNPEE